MLTNQNGARPRLPAPSSSNSRREKRSLTSVIENDDKKRFRFFVEPPLLLLDQKHWLAESELILPKKDKDQELIQQQEREQDEEKKCEMITGMQFQKEQLMRKCSRCLSIQTPQWRMDGSSGPKMFCSACGMRLKAGNELNTISEKCFGQEIDIVSEKCFGQEFDIISEKCFGQEIDKGQEQLKQQGRKKMKKSMYVNEDVPPEEPVRRCTHCMSYKTPQWRAGPLGPKTLCNACGVRYKSGRLLPEYRPANSPSFVSYMHSNSHKKVMQLRQTVAHTEK